MSRNPDTGLPRDPLVCDVCGNEPPFGCWDDCLRCCAATILTNPDAWHSNRPFYMGSPWLPELDAEISRQAEALLASCYITTQVRVPEDL